MTRTIQIFTQHARLSLNQRERLKQLALWPSLEPQGRAENFQTHLPTRLQRLGILFKQWIDIKNLFNISVNCYSFNSHCFQTDHFASKIAVTGVLNWLYFEVSHEILIYRSVSIRAANFSSLKTTSIHGDVSFRPRELFHLEAGEVTWSLFSPWPRLFTSTQSWWRKEIQFRSVGSQFL